jgi:hypothetical protein
MAELGTRLGPTDFQGRGRFIGFHNRCQRWGLRLNFRILIKGRQGSIIIIIKIIIII